MKTKDVKRYTTKTAKCDYCGGYYEPKHVGNHPVNDFGEKYCDRCAAELEPDDHSLNPYSEDYNRYEC